MSIADDRATYEREVLRANTRDKIGVAEQGSGTVSPDGELALTGSAGAQTWSYSATYHGRFEGPRIRLSVTQVWRLPGRENINRPCTIELSHTM